MSFTEGETVAEEKTCETISQKTLDEPPVP